MKRKKLSRSVKQFIRQEKARIRRDVLDIKKQEELINEIYHKFLKKNEDSFTRTKKS